jgi:purine-binding chemotaxis protein CheW
MQSSATTPTAQSNTTASTVTRGGKYLTFALGREEYGIAILKVREIIGRMDITAVPRSAPYVKGVINLRGQVIPVIDLRCKFGMAAVEATDETCVVVVEIERGGRTLSTGLVVDRVKEVLSINDDAIEETPDLGTTVDAQFIRGIGKVGSTVKILLDIDRVLTACETQELTSGAAAKAA